MVAVIHKAKNILNMIVHTIPQTARSICFFLAATIVVIISGSDVHAATIVSHIKF